MQYGEEGSPAALHEVGKLLEESPLLFSAIWNRLPMTPFLNSPVYFFNTPVALLP